MVQAWDFAPGANFISEMQRAGTDARAVLGVLSERYLDSVYTEDEWTAALNDRKLLLARVGGDWPDGLLGTQIAVDLRGAAPDEARNRLLQGAARMLDRLSGGTGRAKPSVAPAFPRPAEERPIRAPSAFPGSRGIRHLPRARNPNFTGREDDLVAISEALERGERVAITGLGGVGKSQLAAEYAHVHASEYEVIWWLRAEDDTTLLEDLALLAAALGVLAEGSTDLGAAAEAARSALEGRTDWLLVFDNADAPERVARHLPNSAGHVLITARPRTWRRIATSYELPQLSRDASKGFLRTRSGDPDAAGAAGSLAEELGDLPLALEQAAAYVEEADSTLASYLEAFRDHQAELLREGVPGDYPASVATTWELSFQALERDAPAAAQLLEIVAFFAPDAIPIRVLTGDPDVLPEHLARAVADPLGFDADVARPLLRYALIDRSGEDVVVHRLVQAVTRARIADERADERVTQAAQLLLASFAFDEKDMSTWGRSGRLLPHALAAALHGESRARTLAGHLLNQCGRYLLLRAQYTESRNALERALAIVEETIGSDTPAAGAVLINLGSVYEALGDYAGARDAYERSLAIDEKEYGPDDLEVASDLGYLGRVLTRLGEFHEALAARERSLAIEKDKLGPDHPRVGTSTANLGIAHQALGDLDAARRAYEEGMAMAERVYGDDHPEFAAGLMNLGGLLLLQGDLDGAREHYERALRIDEAAYGESHPEVATDLRALAAVLVEQEDFAGALELLRRSAAILDETLPPGHPSLVQTTEYTEALERVMRGERPAG